MEGKVNIIMSGEEMKEKEKRVCFESERGKNDIRCDVDGISTSTYCLLLFLHRAQGALPAG
jgi:hypothetical protein